MGTCKWVLCTIIITEHALLLGYANVKSKNRKLSRWFKVAARVTLVYNVYTCLNENKQIINLWWCKIISHFKEQNVSSCEVSSVFLSKLYWAIRLKPKNTTLSKPFQNSSENRRNKRQNCYPHFNIKYCK